MNHLKLILSSVLVLGTALPVANAQSQSATKTPNAYSLQMVRNVALPDIQGHINAIAFSDNDKIAMIRDEGRLHIFDTQKWKLLHTFVPDSQRFPLDGDLSPDGKLVALVNYKRIKPEAPQSKLALEIRDARTGRLRHTFFRSYIPNYVAYAPDGKSLITMSYRLKYASGGRETLDSGATRTLGCWDVQTGRLKWSSYREWPPSNKENNTHGLAFSDNSQTIAVLSHGEVELHDARFGKKLATMTDERGLKEPMVFSPNGKTLATGGDIDGWYTDDQSGFGGQTMPGDGVKLWDTQTGKKLEQVTWNNVYTTEDDVVIGAMYYPLSFWPTSTTLAVTLYDSNTDSKLHLGIFGLRPVKQQANFEFKYIGFTQVFAVTPDCKFLVVASSKDGKSTLEYWKATIN